MPKAKSHLSVRMPPSLRYRLEESAAASHRNVSEQVLYLLKFALNELEMRGQVEPSAGGRLFR